MLTKGDPAGVCGGGKGDESGCGTHTVARFLVYDCLSVCSGEMGVGLGGSEMRNQRDGLGIRGTVLQELQLKTVRRIRCQGQGRNV